MRKKTTIILSLCVFVFALSLVVGGFFVGADKSKRFDNNVFINGESVGGYTVAEASNIVTNKVNQSLDGMSIKIIYQDKVWQFDKQDFEVSDAVKDVVANAFKTTKVSDKQIVAELQKKGGFNTDITKMLKNFDSKIDAIASEINTAPQNAYVEFTPNNAKIFDVVEAKNGVELDKQKLVDDLQKQFFNTKEVVVYAHTNSIEPDLKAEYFDDKLNLQSKFSTSIKNSQEGRRHNVTLALQKLNGTVVKPNEIVSFNALTGPQTASGGYQDAVVIINGKFTNGVGGGICQASTTLYNALVLANVEIAEVHKHTLPVKYVELSLDAMVSDGYADLIFKNTSQNDLYIKSYVLGDDAVVEIYGKSLPEDVTIKRTAEFVGNIPHNGDKIIPDTNGEYSSRVLYKGEYYRLKYPCEGYEAKAYKEYYKNGELIDRELIRHEKYQPQDGIVIEGTQELPEGFVLPKQEVEIIPPQSRN